MRNRLAVRLTSLAFLVVFFAMSGADAFNLHECPHHDRLPASSHHAAPSVDDLPATHATAEPAPEGPDHGSHGATCTCVGDCTASSTPISHRALSARVFQSPATVHADLPVQAGPAPVVTIDFRQPFPIGPPRSA